MKLIVGLGNPGREYVGTRHNIGFDAVEVLAAKLGWMELGNFGNLAREKFGGLVFDGAMETASGSEKLLLVKPMTFMNLSGQCVQQAAAFYKVEPRDILVIVDELALPLGKLRLKNSGSAGGHNGLRSIEQRLGTSQYPRLRIGIDPAPPRVNQSDWVLGKFFPEQREAVDAALGKAAACCVTWAEHGPERAMNQFNAPPEPKKKRDKPKPRPDADATEGKSDSGPKTGSAEGLAAFSNQPIRPRGDGANDAAQSSPDGGPPPEPGL